MKHERSCPEPPAQPSPQPPASLLEIVMGEAQAPFKLARLILPPHSAGPQPHKHMARAEGCYVLRGTLAVTVGERTVTVQPGEAVYVAPGSSCAYWNPTAATCVALLIFAPGEHVPDAGQLPGHVGRLPPEE